MSVMIGSARINENGTVSGGRPGDQTGWEVTEEEYYHHSLGWDVLRAFDSDVREWLAADMSAACNNPNIGYSQALRNTLWDAAKNVNFDCSRVNRACDADCSSLVRVCAAYAGIEVPDFYTGNECEVLLRTGHFELMGDLPEADLMRGDILVTKKQGHTAIVITNGDNIAAPAPDDHDLAVAASVITGDYDNLVDYLAHRVLAGDFGNGENRYRALRGLYKDVQKRVNEIA